MHACLMQYRSLDKKKTLSVLATAKADMTAAKMLEQKQFYYSYFTVFHW